MVWEDHWRAHCFLLGSWFFKECVLSRVSLCCSSRASQLWLVLVLFNQLNVCFTEKRGLPSSSWGLTEVDTYWHFGCLGEKRLQLTEGDPAILLLLPPQRGQSLPSLHPLLTMKTTNTMTQVSAPLQSSRNKRAEKAPDLGHTEGLVLAWPRGYPGKDDFHEASGYS